MWSLVWPGPTHNTVGGGAAILTHGAPVVSVTVKVEANVFLT
jgi:hypothetical protein